MKRAMCSNNVAVNGCKVKVAGCNRLSRLFKIKGTFWIKITDAMCGETYDVFMEDEEYEYIMKTHTIPVTSVKDGNCG